MIIAKVGSQNRANIIASSSLNKGGSGFSPSSID